MRILHVTKKYPPALGGDAVVVSQLQAQQERNGHTVAVLTTNSIASSGSVYTYGLRDTSAGLDAITIKRIVSLIGLAFKMFHIIHKERPNVIHTHSIDMAFFVSFAARLYRVPVVHTFHIVTFYDPKQTWLRRKTELWFARHARLHCVTAPNKYDVMQLQKAGLPQTVLLPNGVDIEYWEVGDKKHQGGVFRFVAVGRLERQKGYEYLIRAVALLASATTQSFHVTIVGAGSQEKALKNLVKEMKVAPYISFAGRKKSDAVRMLLAEADGAIFPSLYETTPLTLLEAWAASVPVIATPVGILRDIAAPASPCQMVPCKDSQALMSAMKHFIEDTVSRRLLAEKGFVEAQKYAWPRVAQHAETIYRSIA